MNTLKTAIIAFRQKNAYFPSETLDSVIDLLNGNNFSVDVVTVIHADDKESFKETFARLDGYFVLVLNSSHNEYEICEAIDGFDKINHVFSDGERKVMIVEDSPRYLKIIEKRFLPELITASGTDFGKVTFKLFGVEERALRLKLDEIAYGIGGIRFNVIGEFLDYKVEIIYDRKSTKMNYDEAQKAFINAFKDNIYAECDVSLQQRLVDVLKLRRCMISTAESFTGGNVARKIVSVSGASEVFYEGIASYNFEAKIARLGVERATINKFKPVSGEVASAMAKGLMTSGKVNVGISTTGIAGPNSDDSDFPVGLCYIGVAFDGRINVYKYNFDGDRNAVINKGTNAAMFLAVKKLKDI